MLERLDPKGQGLRRLFRLVDALPFEGGDEIGTPDVAAMRPEGVERHVVLGATRMVRRPVDGTERRLLETEGAGALLAPREEGNADALSAIGRQQYGFAEIVERGRIET